MIKNTKINSMQTEWLKKENIHSRRLCTCKTSKEKQMVYTVWANILCGNWKERLRDMSYVKIWWKGGNQGH